MPAALLGDGGRVDGMTKQTRAVPDGDLCLAIGTVSRCQFTLHGLPARKPQGWFPVQVNFRRLDRELPTPAHAHDGDGGVDLYSAQDVIVGPGESASVLTGVAVQIPPGYAGLVTPRSGLAARHGIGILNAPGLVDAGYRGEIRVLIINHGTEKFEIQRGDRVAQLVVVPVVSQEWVEVEELETSDRGPGGFGSTGR